MVPAAAPSVTAFSQSAWAGSMICGAVGPTGLPKIQLMPMRIRLMPITKMIVPVTTGGKKRSILDTKGAMISEITPAAMMAPKMARAASLLEAPAPSCALAMATIGPTAAKVTPIMTGRRMPNHWVAPKDWISVTMPQTNRSAEIRKATSSGGSFSARPTISGTATAPAYITRTCCRPRVKSLGGASISSTGWVLSVIRSFPGGCFLRAVFAPPLGREPVRFGALQAPITRQACA